MLICYSSYLKVILNCIPWRPRSWGLNFLLSLSKRKAESNSIGPVLPLLEQTDRLFWMTKTPCPVAVGPLDQYYVVDPLNNHEFHQHQTLRFRPCWPFEWCGTPPLQRGRDGFTACLQANDVVSSTLLRIREIKRLLKKVNGNTWKNRPDKKWCLLKILVYNSGRH